MRPDVIVVGGGNAALCAALSARERGAEVLLLERAGEEARGGNSRYTRNVRCAHGPDAYLTGSYDEEEFLDDLVKVNGEGFDRELALLAIRESRSLPGWMEEHGVRWQRPFRGTLHLARTNKFFLGGGKALVNAYYDAARRAGVTVLYGALVEGFAVEDGRCEAVLVSIDGKTSPIPGKAVVVASGGFEADLGWLRRYWGPAAENFVIRGTRFNDGKPLAALLALGAAERGSPGGFHATAVDARSPRFDGGIVTRVDSVPFGITVNALGERFYDEGEELWPKRYAIWGRLIAEQPGQLAYSVFDAKAAGRFVPPLYPPLRADSPGELAGLIEVDPATLERTVERFNEAAAGASGYDPSMLDGCGTRGLEPPKSNWALPIDTPPFFAYPLRPGVTFTYLGVAVDGHARVLRASGGAFANVYAAGEAMAGNILLRGYLGGFGITIGSVFGRIAGTEAAAHARA